MGIRLEVDGKPIQTGNKLAHALVSFELHKSFPNDRR